MYASEVFLCSKLKISHKLLCISISYYEVRKGGIILSSSGYLQIHAFTSKAQLPLAGVALTVTDAGGAAIAMRLTNRNGQLDAPIELSVPELSAGQSPNTGVIPYSTVNLYARIENYEEIEVERVQIFPDTVTVQGLEMIPLSELPGQWNKSEIFDTQTQNL